MERLGVLVLSTVLALAGCGGAAGFGERTPGSDSHRLRLEVSCDTCLIRWSAGPDGGQLQETGLWSERLNVHVHPDAPITARITATTVPGSRPVAYVRIRVDGDVVAEARSDDGSREGMGGAGSTLAVEAVIPGARRRPAIAGGDGPPSDAAGGGAAR